MQDNQQPLQQPSNDQNGPGQNPYTPPIQNPQFTPYAQQQPVNYQNNNQQIPYNQTYQTSPYQQQAVDYQDDGNPMPYANTQGNQFQSQQQPAFQGNGQQVTDPNAVSVQQPISVSVGSPESAPVPVATEQTKESVEYGDEKLRQIERTSENLQQIENKETRNPQNDDQQSEKKQIPVTQLPPAKPQGPKIFGYHIPQSITTNINAIRERKGTGDPQDATTWIYVLLDKLLKRQTYQD